MDHRLDISFLRRADGAILPGMLTYRVDPDHRVALGPHDGPAASATGADLFDAFTAARRDLERKGLIPLVRGARPDCFPSGMARSMGDGDQIYRLVLGKRPSLNDLGFLFDPADAEAVGTVDEQESFFAAWLSERRG